MTDAPTLSATQVVTFQLCPRKWAWRYRDGVESDPHPSAAKGTLVHDRLERWLKHATPLDLDEVVEVDGKPFHPGRVAAAGLKHLPKPGTEGLKVEERITLTTERATFIGYVDAGFIEDGIPVVLDHKTTSDFKWSKTSEDLRTDVQAAIYAAHSMLQHSADEVEARWVYYLARGKPKSKLVSLRLNRADVERAFEPIEASAVEMLGMHRYGVYALDVDPNPHACDMYGGCFYRDRCNLTPIERMRALMAKQTLAEKMAERKKTAAEAAPIETAPEPKPSNGAGINPPEAETAPAPATEPEPPKTTRKRGRPPKKDPTAEPTAPVVAASPSPAATIPAPAQGAHAAPGGFTLMVNALPTKGVLPVVDFRTVVDPIAASVAGAHGVPDYRLIPYAQGPAYLAEALTAHLTRHPIAGVAITLDAHTDEGKHALGVLERFATTVVRGF